MPVIQQEKSIAANSTDPNIISGSAFEIARGRQLVSMGVTGAAAGLLLTITSGSDLILAESAVYIKTQFPIIPDEMFYNDVQESADRLVLQIRNSTGGALVVRAVVLISALG